MVNHDEYLQQAGVGIITPAASNEKNDSEYFNYTIKFFFFLKLINSVVSSDMM